MNRYDELEWMEWKGVPSFKPDTQDKREHASIVFLTFSYNFQNQITQPCEGQTKYCKAAMGSTGNHGF